MSKETIEVAIFKSKFPNEDFCPDNFNEWVSENAGEAYDMCLYLAVQQLEDCKKESVPFEKVKIWLRDLKDIESDMNQIFQLTNEIEQALKESK